MPVISSPRRFRTPAVLVLSLLTAAAWSQPADVLPLPPIEAAEAALSAACEPAPCEWLAAGPGDWQEGPDFELGVQFDKGLFIRSTDLQERPYALYIGGRLQLRYTGFARDLPAWTDSAGVTRPVRNRSEFDSERMRLNISGTAVLPELRYYLIFDGDSDGASEVDQLAYYAAYEFAEGLEVAIGRWKVAACRQWLLSSRFQRMVDRSLASEYFRPAFSDGVYLWGDIGDFCHHEWSLTNGLRTSQHPSFSLDDGFCAAGAISFDPWGPFGNGDADYACHASPVLRYGASLALSKSSDRSDAGFPLGDDSFLRLSDGTLLSQVGALAPGVRVLGVETLVASFDAGLKWRGWSVNGEYFLRSLHDFRADGALGVGSLYDYGYHAEVGCFLIPRRLDVNARLSQVSGMMGDSYERSGGLNWYWGDGRDDRINKLSLDVTDVVRSAVSSSGADLLPGDDGLLVRAQVQIGF
ncbi:Phosphate-selective porin O and P [Posidoniimonas polymericola]|uniref:Phosphate-selective porin O and P n=1 Tax=Posidoniimonas polymericola TaxID=2528002 RepID=A0A5C5XU93_9BACT|nr:hypothetical protein [Posidoniimonas polymericola]TWT66797.1 Phosphate-selective porin O and P [Posidoniimonas polymericola]